jgi:predicted thioredoxin/glutaredoxin
MAFRKFVFSQTLEQINLLNNDMESSAHFATNILSDRTEEERDLLSNVIVDEELYLEEWHDDMPQEETTLAKSHAETEPCVPKTILERC